MTGPEHYREAEASLARAKAAIAKAGEAGPLISTAEALGASVQIANLIAVAQVHATEALGAATGMRWVLPEDAHAWRQAVGAAQAMGGGPS